MAKRKYGTWGQDDMEMALQAYRNGDMGFNQCSRQYGIPKPTLKRHLDGANVYANEGCKSFGRNTTLPPRVEQELVDYILKLESLLFGLCINDVRSLAFQIAEKNEIPHNFSQETRMAGKKWFYSFKARHPELTYREPQATSLARVKGFNKENVYEFFDILQKIVEENAIDATRIFNVDESGVSTVQTKCKKVLAQRGKKQVGAVSSGERGVNTTIVCCTSASGSYVPPMIIFKRKQWTDQLKIGAPPGSVVTISDSGYITSELFVKWMTHFIATVKPTPDNKVILVLDGHTTHSKNLEALDLSRNHGVILLQLPAHTTHRVQPLDRSFFGPLKGYYNQAVQKWLRTNPGLSLTQYQVSETVAEAYGKAATIENAVSGFKACGIWPVDRSVFKDCDFYPAENLTFDNIVETSTPTCGEQPVSTVEKDAHFGDGPDDSLEIRWPNIPSPDRAGTESGEQKATKEDSTLKLSIEQISPVPKPKKLKNKTSSGAQKAKLLTSSPYKAELQMAKDLQAAQEKVRELKMKMGKTKPKITIKKEKKDKIEKKSSGSKKKPVSVKRNLQSAITSCLPTTSDQSGVVLEMNKEDWFCSVCEETSVEDMVKCTVCQTWAHERCTRLTKSGLKYYTCLDCKM